MNKLGIDKLLLDNGAYRNFYKIVNSPNFYENGKFLATGSLVFNDIKNFIKTCVNISDGFVYIYDIKYEKNSYYIRYYYDINDTNKIKQRILKLKKLNLM